MDDMRQFDGLSYEDAIIASLRMEGHPESAIDLMRTWLSLSPEKKKIAMEILLEFDAKNKAGKAA